MGGLQDDDAHLLASLEICDELGSGAWHAAVATVGAVAAVAAVGAADERSWS